VNAGVKENPKSETKEAFPDGFDSRGYRIGDNMFRAFPKIGQYRQTVKYANSKHDPIRGDIPYVGTVKLHGTNAALILTPDNEIKYQSRKRLIDPTNDNFGFARYMYDIGQKDANVILSLFNHFQSHMAHKDYVLDTPLYIYGEWCGQGVQQGVAISQVPKRWVIFAAGFGAPNNGTGRTTWLTPNELKLMISEEHGIYNAFTLPTYEININFTHPELVRNELVDITEAIDKLCPVGKTWGVTGHGEGVVWRPIDPQYISDMWFKVKGEKHAVTHVKKLAAIDPVKVHQVNDFIDMVCTENRLKQGIEHLKEMNMELSRKSTGDFLRWIFNDVIAEETDTLIANDLTQKQIGGKLSQKAREWYFNYIENQYEI